MARIVAHCVCRSLEVLIVLGVFQMALILEAWVQV